MYLLALAEKNEAHHAVHDENTVENDGCVFGGNLKEHHHEEQDDGPCNVNHASFEQRSMGRDSCEPVTQEEPTDSYSLILASRNGWADRNSNETKRALTGPHNPSPKMCHFVAGGRDNGSALIFARADDRYGLCPGIRRDWLGTSASVPAPKEVKLGQKAERGNQEALGKQQRGREQDRLFGRNNHSDEAQIFPADRQASE
ncbi:hypothetical protein [Bradyrhizobium sp. CCGE-LA001]|uniref:hypothetical protein n=1 Tax=Bradyrhizobium sp. CCGE-LA001 TaxID=1223566 RepID=UPI001198255E|nr:hypothetical protein [Bradyrhizobium sp. CCGE-LA001]